MTIHVYYAKAKAMYIQLKQSAHSFDAAATCLPALLFVEYIALPEVLQCFQQGQHVAVAA
jgi:hypothetical protein